MGRINWVSILEIFLIGFIGMLFFAIMIMIANGEPIGLAKDALEAAKGRGVTGADLKEYKDAVSEAWSNAWSSAAMSLLPLPAIIACCIGQLLDDLKV